MRKARSKPKPETHGELERDAGSSSFPRFPILHCRRKHFCRSVMKPKLREFLERRTDSFRCPLSAQMNICGFETHGKKQLGFVAHFGHRGEFDARTVWSQTADDPAALLFYKRIRAADGGIQDLTVEN